MKEIRLVRRGGRKEGRKEGKTSKGGDHTLWSDSTIGNPSHGRRERSEVGEGRKEGGKEVK